MIGFGSFAQVKNITKSSVTFKIKNLGINTGGVIPSVQGTVNFDPAKPADGKIEAIADVTTIDTDNDTRDNHLKGENFFDVTKYPKITMKSVSISRKGANNYIGQFNLTIKDKTKLVSVPFTYTEAGSIAKLNGSFKINRKEFGVGGGSFTLSDEATITIEVEAAK